MLQILMSDLASVQSIHQNLCTNEKNSFINLHKNCLHVTLKAKFKPFKVNSVYLIVYYIRIFMKINSLISSGIFQLISDIIYMYIFTLRVTLFGGYKFGGSKSTITINPVALYWWFQNLQLITFVQVASPQITVNQCWQNFDNCFQFVLPYHQGKQIFHRVSKTKLAVQKKECWLQTGSV